MNTPQTYSIALTDPYATPHEVGGLGFPFDCAPGHADHHINPFRDRDGQPCAPEYWGFRRVMMGGGIWAYELLWDGDHEETFYLSASDAGARLPAPNDWMLGRYVMEWDGHECQEAHWTLTVVPNRSEAILEVYPRYYDYEGREYQR